MSEDSFVIRIYRRSRSEGAADGRQRRTDRVVIYGTVDVVNRSERFLFGDIESLWAVLSHGKKRKDA